MKPTLVCSCAAAPRLARAKAWLAERSSADERLVVAASAEAASELLRSAAVEAGAAFGWHRASLARLAASLAEPALVERDLVPVGRLVTEAVVARVVHAARGEASLGRYAGVADSPGFARAMAGALEELRLAGAGAETLAKLPAELRALCEGFDEKLAEAGLADRASVLALAGEAASDPKAEHPLLGLPTLLLDVAVHTAAERRLLEALVRRAPDVLATAPAGDGRTREALADLGFAVEDVAPPGASASLPTLQAHLFEATAPAPADLDDDVAILSAPGESRECVEVARRLLGFARAGIPFDRMAVLLRSPEEYRPHLEEALARAGVPAHFARGAVQPDPAGRAFLALLACAGEGLSARAFAEYLSLGEVPDATREGEPPPSPPPSERWVAPDEELVPEVISAALAAASAPGEIAAPSEPAPDDAPVTGGSLRAPRRWEQLLVDAAVIGGRERWERRLRGLEREVELDRRALDDPDDPDDAIAQRLLRQHGDLAALRGFALPLLDELAALPAEAAWRDWLDRLSALAARALRHPVRVLAVLSELAPMAGVGPVALHEVRLVLGRRLLELAVPPPASRHGRVFVAPCDAARGLAFDVVCVPGLAEKLFPRQIAEEPILLDRARRDLGCGLATNEDRVQAERLALRLAVGAARKKLVLSYPRLDMEKARPRVPSFYGLEVLRAAEGRLPGFDELQARAETVTDARVGWPAPRNPDDAIDAAEHDLALLDRLLELDEEKSKGTARYLVLANPHLGRALRFRARRWHRAWSGADGLLETKQAISPGAREAIATQQTDARSFSPTALQHYAACPYRFFLQAIHRLTPRDVPEAIDEMNALQKGSLVHEALFAFFERARDEGLLPVTPDNADRARDVLDEVLTATAERFQDDLAPAIERVWDDGIAAIRADLREWLGRLAADDSGFVPWRFELAFGPARGRSRDPASVDDPVKLDCGLTVRGSIDLVERRGDGTVRVTDHKTGRARFRDGDVVAGGEALQPVFYALVAEKLFPDAAVESGRLSYCTSAGGFQDRSVPLDRAARESADAVARAVGAALAKPFLPAAPREGACTWCDFQSVCGPYEELRTRRKYEAQPELDALRALRDLP